MSRSTSESELSHPQSRRERFFAIGPDGRSSLPLRIVMAAIVAACFVAIAYAFSTAQTEPAVKLPAEIEALNPVQDAQTVPRQSTVSVDLRFGLTGELNIDGVDIPADESVYEKSQAILSFSPAPGKVMRVLPGGLRRATITYWPVGSTREATGQSFSWTFTVT